MTANLQLLYAILAMDSYHRGNVGGINDYIDVRPTQIDGAVFLVNNPDNPYGFSAQAYSLNGETIIAYRGTDDGTLSSSFPFIDPSRPDALYGYPISARFSTARTRRLRLRQSRSVGMTNGSP